MPALHGRMSLSSNCIERQVQFIPLSRDRNEIRLLRLVLKPRETIRLEPEVHELGADCLPYVALSYTWGSEVDPAAIVLGGHPFLVRRNLYNFLQAYSECLVKANVAMTTRNHAAEPGIHLMGLPHEFCTTYIWIDQICINQESIGERNHQVQLMRLIYTHAVGVICWLGNDEEVKLELQRLHCEYVRKNHTNGASSGGLDPRPSEAQVPKLEQNPYWKRVWIVQEVMLAEQIVVMVCDKVLEWRELDWYYEAYFQRTTYHNLRVTSFAFDRRLRRQMVADEPDHGHGVPTSNDQELASLLWKYSDSQCGDHRHKVYGLLGLMSSNISVEVDYNLSRKEVFESVVKFFVEHDMSNLDRSGILEPESGETILDILWNLYGEMNLHARIASRSYHVSEKDQVAFRTYLGRVTMGI